MPLLQSAQSTEGESFYSKSYGPPHVRRVGGLGMDGEGMEERRWGHYDEKEGVESGQTPRKSVGKTSTTQLSA